MLLALTTDDDLHHKCEEVRKKERSLRRELRLMKSCCDRRKSLCGTYYPLSFPFGRPRTPRLVCGSARWPTEISTSRVLNQARGLHVRLSHRVNGGSFPESAGVLAQAAMIAALER